MSITRKQAETILLKRVGEWLKAINCTAFDVRPSGKNETLDDPISFALRQCGIVPADLLVPVDTDLAQLSDAYIDRFLDYAEWRILSSAYQGTVPEDRKIFDSVFNALRDAVEKKQKHLRDAYGYGLAIEDTMPVVKAYEAEATEDQLIEYWSSTTTI